MAKSFFSKTFTGFLLLYSCIVFGQKSGRNSIESDLKNLSTIEFYKKYSSYHEGDPKEDMEATKFIWSSKHLRSVHKQLNEKGIPTITQVLQRPSDENKYYVIGHYQLPEPGHLSRMSNYRIDLKNKTIEYQGLADLAEDKWTKVE